MSGQIGPRVSQPLLDLCLRDEQVALLGHARRALAAGDDEARFVVAWMEQLLAMSGPPVSGDRR